MTLSRNSKWADGLLSTAFNDFHYGIYCFFFSRRGITDAWTTTGPDDPEIKDHPDVVGNETLLALQHAMQQFSRAKRKLAELYFFQGMTINAIACSLRMDEAVVRDLILQTLGKIVDELHNWSAAQLNFPGSGSQFIS